MPQFDQRENASRTNRREILRFGSASLAIGLLASLQVGCKPEQEETAGSKKPMTGSETTENQTKNKSGANMKIQYLEIVTTEVDALCKQYEATNEVSFGQPDANLGGARTAKLSDGGLIGIRGPLRETETPVVRPYVLVDDLKASVAAAADAGAEIALPSMEIPEHGTIAVVIHGGIECGLWQNSSDS